MEIIDFYQIILGVIQLLATILISIILVRHTNKLKRIETQNQAFNAYNALNLSAISSDDNLIAFDSLGRANIDEDIKIRRKRWCSFIWLETLQVTFFGMKKGMIDDKYANQALRQQLKIILNDDDVFWLVRYRGFDPTFINYCKRIRKELNKPEEISFKNKLIKNESKKTN